MRAVLTSRRFRRQPRVSVSALVFLTLGSCAFALALYFWLVDALDALALACVSGYAFCALAFVAPLPANARTYELKWHHTGARATSSALNALGLALGILGSVATSPLVADAVVADFDKSSDIDRERATDFANGVWCASFACFPIASALALRERMEAVKTAQEEDVERWFRHDVEFHAWILGSLNAFCVGGFLFCLDDDPNAVVWALVFFSIGAGIKAALVAREIAATFSHSRCDDVEDGSPTETSPLLGEGSSDAPSLMGDADSIE